MISALPASSVTSKFDWTLTVRCWRSQNRRLLLPGHPSHLRPPRCGTCGHLDGRRLARWPFLWRCRPRWRHRWRSVGHEQRRSPHIGRRCPNPQHHLPRQAAAHPVVTISRWPADFHFQWHLSICFSFCDNFVLPRFRWIRWFLYENWTWLFWFSRTCSRELRLLHVEGGVVLCDFA